MKQFLSGVALTIVVMAAAGFARAKTATTGPLRLADLTLDRAFSTDIPFASGLPFVIPTVANGSGFVLRQAWLEPWIGCTAAESTSAIAVRIEIDGIPQRTLCFQAERYSNTSLTASGNRDRVVTLDPPVIVKPGQTAVLTPMLMELSTTSWVAASPTTTLLRIGVGGYVAYAGEV